VYHYGLPYLIGPNTSIFVLERTLINNNSIIYGVGAKNFEFLITIKRVCLD